MKIATDPDTIYFSEPVKIKYTVKLTIKNRLTFLKASLGIGKERTLFVEAMDIGIQR